jgi:DNA-binding HxlR family transcriptional regulator
MMSMCDSARAQVDELLVLLSKSKMLNVLYILNCDPKPLRFSEIKARVNSSSTTVTRRLSELEAHGLVNRSVFPTVPTTVEYTLTPDAVALAPSLESLFEWVLNRADVRA